MDQMTLSADARTKLKSGASRKLRREGSIPAIVYGHGDPISITVDAREFTNAFKIVGESHILSLSIDGVSRDVLIKDYQRDLLTGQFHHVDFYEFERGKTLRTSVPVRLEGSSTGVRAGGVLGQPLHELDIECLPKDIPEGFTIDISALEIGDSVHVSDMAIPDGVRVLNNEDQVVVLVSAARAEEVEEEEEAEAGELEGEAAEGEEPEPEEEG